MATSNFVFILSGAQPIILHPFGSPQIFGPGETLSLAGRYGSGSVPGNTDSLRKNLYEYMEKGTRRHFLDKGYYLRLALSTAAFIVVYLFFSIFVRDPVPLIDELLLGSLAAVAVFLISERRALASPAHLDSMLRLRRAIDAAFFSESRVVDLVEAWRDDALALGPAAFYKADPAPTTLSPEEQDEAAALCAVLAARWKHKPVVAELYDALRSGRSPGTLLDKAAKRLGPDECALALAYLRLIPLALEATP